MNDSIEILKDLCVSAFGVSAESVSSLPQSGGDRAYFRLYLQDGRTVLGVVADNTADASAFCGLSRCFKSAGVNVPLVYASTPGHSYYLVEDLGNTSLFSILGTPRAVHVIELTLRQLVRMQTVDSRCWENLTVYKPFSPRQVMWDLNYFKYEFLKPSNVIFDEDALEDDFERLAHNLTDVPESMYGFMMRDCQSRNVMVVNDEDNHDKPYFIDFQGGRRGPCLYDAISFLWQAKADFTDEFKNRMLRVYADAFSAIRGIGIDVILGYAPLFALFRTLQVLGAYGYRGLVQKRSHFIESIPFALKNLSKLSEAGVIEDYPELNRLSRILAVDPRFDTYDIDRLTIKVFSFSYKRGYPDDLSGNGGGFMFDCRGMHNPGRYDEFKPLTGLDRPVVDFLKDRGEVDSFVSKAVDIVSPSVECYVRRGFKSLQVGFGCTGGRHRSVYCAHAFAQIIAEKYPDVLVELCHREQNISQTFNSKL